MLALNSPLPNDQETQPTFGDLHEKADPNILVHNPAVPSTGHGNVRFSAQRTAKFQFAGGRRGAGATTKTATGAATRARTGPEARATTGTANPPSPRSPSRATARSADVRGTNREICTPCC